MTNTLDISTVEVSETFDVEILNPKTGEPMIVGGKTTTDPETGATKVEGGKPLSVTVYGPGSKPFKAAQAAQSQREVLRIKRNGGKSKPKTAEEVTADAANLLSAITISFNNFGYKGMEPDREMFRALYLDPKMGWITDQVNSQAGDWGNFTNGSSTN